MTTITGKQLINAEFVTTGSNSFTAFNPANNDALQHQFTEASQTDAEDACNAAAAAFTTYSKLPGTTRALFLEAIAEEIMTLGDELLETAASETGLPMPRLQGERGRTVGQLKLFATMLRQGNWVNAIIDTAVPDRQPLPKADIRQMQIPLGPVGVFGASNFPFAFSVAGGDTVSALAAGCSVVFKGHPAHPATCELVAAAIAKAIKACNMPTGVFGLLQGASHQLGTWLVQHPLIKAVGFTGSFRGGKALFDLAAARPEPIPVYAEMGSVNPVFFLPGAIAEKRETLAKNFAASVTLGAGQFCTNPGLFVVSDNSESSQFIDQTRDALHSIVPGPLLTKGIKESYLHGIQQFTSHAQVTTHTNPSDLPVQPHLFTTTVQALQQDEQLAEEVFGPCTMGVKATSKQEMLEVATTMRGHLTASVFGTDADLQEHRDLVEALTHKVGRVIINAFPTGVEVTHAMVHGGPFPATTDSRSTSVGTTAIYRFTRPVCFQDFPETLLPEELKKSNPLQIWRTVNGSNTNATMD